MNTQTQPSSAAVPFPLQDRILLEWSAPVHPVHDRSPRWYAYGSLFIVGCAVYGVLTDAWSFSLVILLLGGMYFLTRHAPHVVKRMSIGAQGFTLGEQFTPWGSCKDFWIISTPSYAELHIARKARWNAEAIVHLGEIDASRIRACLSQFIPERPDQKERLVDMCIRFFKL